MELNYLTIKEASDLIRKQEISPVEITNAVLESIRKHEPKINSFITVLEESALDAAVRAENQISKGNYLGPLHGIPVALKDLFVMQGAPSTSGSRMLENFMSPYNATVTEKLLEAGAVVIGKNNMDEFAMGSSNETSFFGPVKNPWDPDRVPGGSSGGCAAATSAGFCLGSVGTDTGGSIRQPASLCGVVGMKPTYGRVSRYGMIAFASSLDQAGPIARTVEDAAIILRTIAGHDPRDSTSVNTGVPDYISEIAGGMKGLKVGVPAEYFIEGMDPDVEKHIKEALDVIRSSGAEIIEISLPHTRYAILAYYIIAPSEASSNLARYDGVRYGYRTPDARSLRDLYFKTRSEGFGEEVKRRIMLGTYALSSGYYDAYYLKAQKVRTLVRKDFTDAFRKVDVIMAPTTPEVAFRFGDKTDDPLKMYLSDILTIPANIAGIPGISVPCGLNSEGLPIGLQILGKPFDEISVLKTGYTYQLNTEWHNKRPNI